jgi:hypothetical protein
MRSNRREVLALTMLSISSCSCCGLELNLSLLALVLAHDFCFTYRLDLVATNLGWTRVREKQALAVVGNMSGLDTAVGLRPEN